MTGSLFSKLKFALMTLAAVLFVLVGAFTMGGRAVRQAFDEKARLQSTVDVKNEILNEVRRKDASAVHRELHDKWLRD